MIIRLAFFSADDLPKDLTETLDAIPFGEDDRARLRSIKNDASLRHSVAARMALLTLCPDGDRTIVRGEQGKPRFCVGGMPHFSLSHAGGLSVAAVSDEPCGVDLEACRASLDTKALADRFFSDKDREALRSHGDFFALWTKKEATVKCLGTSLSELLGKDLALPTRTYRKENFTLSLAAEHEFSVEFQEPNSPLQEVFL